VKVLHVLWSDYLSGAEKIVLKISRMMKSNFGVSIGVACFNGSNSAEHSLEKMFKEEGVEVFTSERKLLHFVKIIKKAIITFRPDVVHSHDYRATLATILARFLILKNRPIHIAHIHDAYPFMERINLKSLVGFFVLSLPSKILAVSDHILNGMWFSKLIRNKTFVLLNPYLGKVTFISRKEAIRKKNVDLIFVGRLVPKKHPEIFCEVCKRLNVKGIIIGTGPLKDELKERYRNSVEFLGYRKDAENWMMKSKFLFLPSEYEGFGLVIIEAIANYCIPIVTPWKGVTKIIECNKTGFIVPWDVNLASGRIKDLLVNYGEIFEEFYNTRLKTLGNFSLGDYVEKLKQIYEMLVCQKGGGDSCF